MASTKNELSLPIRSELVLSPEGIYYTKEKSDISYPEEGNARCYQVEDNSFWFKHRNRVILDMVEKHAPAGAFYDIGGGNGFVTKGLQDAGYTAVLLEPGPQGVRNARERGVENVICATFQDIDFEPGTVAAAGCFDVVEHIEDDVHFLRELTESLRPDGRLFITVPAFQGLWSGHDVEAGHYRRYTLATLTEAGRQAGLRPVVMTYFFKSLTLPIFLQRSIPHKLGMGKAQTDEQKAATLQKQLSGKKGIVERVLNQRLEVEFQHLKSGKSQSFGSSIFVVFEKMGV